MAGRPWYVQAADATHRVVVLGIMGFSGYLAFQCGKAVLYNHETKQRRALEQAAVAEVVDEAVAAQSQSN